MSRLWGSGNTTFKRRETESHRPPEPCARHPPALVPAGPLAPGAAGSMPGARGLGATEAPPNPDPGPDEAPAHVRAVGTSEGGPRGRGCTGVGLRALETQPSPHTRSFCSSPCFQESTLSGSEDSLCSLHPQLRLRSRAADGRAGGPGRAGPSPLRDPPVSSSVGQTQLPAQVPQRVSVIVGSPWRGPLGTCGLRTLGLPREGLGHSL